MAGVINTSAELCGVIMGGSIRVSRNYIGPLPQGNCMSEPRLVIEAQPQSDMPAFTRLNNKSRTKSRLRS
jgi:hypothetical protein